MIFSRGIIARNILQTDVIKILLDDTNIQLVLLVPENMPEYFNDLLQNERVVIEETKEPKFSKMHKLFWILAQKLVYTKTSKFFLKKSGRRGKDKRHPFIYLFGHPLALFFSKLKILIKISRWIENNIFKNSESDYLIEKHKPDLVVATMMKTKREVALIKSAKRFNIKTIGMTRSWDNLDRILVTCLTDKIVVQNEAMKQIGFDWHRIPLEKFFVAGFPQFDLYKNKDTFYLMQEFYKQFTLESDRRTIMFGSEGVWIFEGSQYAKILAEMVQNNEFDYPCQLIVRPHFSDLDDDGKSEYDFLDGQNHVYLDKKFRFSKFFTDKWDPSFEEMKKMANELFHSDVLVTFASTLSLEASILDTPVININFKAREESEDLENYLGTYYKSSHYSRIADSGAIKFALSRENLKELINRYLRNPEFERNERKAVSDWLAPYIGESGKRLGNFLIQELNKI